MYTKVYLRKLKILQAQDTSIRHFNVVNNRFAKFEISEGRGRKTQEAQELTENKAILEEIELREKEEEMRTQS